MIVPKDELVRRPSSWLMKQGLFDEAEAWREPQAVCNECSSSLRPLQHDLRLQVSRCNMESEADTSTGKFSMPNLPTIDFHLEQEISNAASMLTKFYKDGEHKIPRSMLDSAKGVAFLTVLKVGFGFSGRYGTGLVIARLSDNNWSAPSAISLTGLGWGLQFGGEVTEVMLILTTDTAVETFKSRGQVTLGAELGVSVGPVGKSVESDVTAGNKGATHAFSYANSRGLFVGASLEASIIVQRKETNKGYYGEVVGASTLLAGEFMIPRGAEPLYKALDVLLYADAPDGARQRILVERELTRRQRYDRILNLHRPATRVGEPDYHATNTVSTATPPPADDRAGGPLISYAAGVLNAATLQQVVTDVIAGVEEFGMKQH